VLEIDKFVIGTGEANAVRLRWWQRPSVPFDREVPKNGLEIEASVRGWSWLLEIFYCEACMRALLIGMHALQRTGL
jgi:hypothetical protein